VVDEQAERFIASFSDLRKVLGAGFKHAHQQGFSTTQFMVLGLVEKAQETEPCTISSIARRLGIDPATVVRTVDSLEKRGLVERRRDKQDRRRSSSSSPLLATLLSWKLIGISSLAFVPYSSL